MSERKHTPGPWRVVMAEPYRQWPREIVTSARGYDRELNRICGWSDLKDHDLLAHDDGVYGSSLATHTEATSNAYLIAAAPDLLEALSKMLEECPCDPDINEDWLAAWEGAKAAIAKARGRHD